MDVVVIDGFIGNVIFKMLEGFVLFIFKMMREVMMFNFILKFVVVVLKLKLKEMKMKMEYLNYGGVSFFGLKVFVIKVYGFLDLNVVFYVIC